MIHDAATKIQGIHSFFSHILITSIETNKNTPHNPLFNMRMNQRFPGINPMMGNPLQQHILQLMNARNFQSSHMLGGQFPLGQLAQNKNGQQPQIPHPAAHFLSKLLSQQSQNQAQSKNNDSKGSKTQAQNPPQNIRGPTLNQLSGNLQPPQIPLPQVPRKSLEKFST